MYSLLHYLGEFFLCVCVCVLLKIKLSVDIILNNRLSVSAEKFIGASLHKTQS